MTHLQPDDPALRTERDHLVIATARGGRVRGAAVRSTETVTELMRRHDLSPVSTIALGRLAVCTQLMAAGLKNPTDVMSVTLRCDGPLRGMVMVSDARSRVRGYAMEPHAVLVPGADGKIHFREAVQSGSLTVVKDLGLKKPYSGTVALVSGEIAEDLTAYLAISEQVPSVLAAGVLLGGTGVRLAGGLLVQLMPDATEADIDYIERRAAGFPDISFLLSEGFTPAECLDLFWGDPALNYLDCRPVGFHCNCSRPRMLRNLLAIGRADLAELAEDPNGVELVCHFCGTSYAFDQAAVRDLLTAGKPHKTTGADQPV